MGGKSGLSFTHQYSERSVDSPVDVLSRLTVIFIFILDQRQSVSWARVIRRARVNSPIALGVSRRQPVSAE